MSARTIPRRVAILLAILFAFLPATAVAQAQVVNSGTLTLITSDPFTQIGAPAGEQLPQAVADYSANEYIVNFIDETPSGASIHFANWYVDPLDDSGVIGALNAAADRGVDVSVVLDNQTGTSRGEAAAAALGNNVDLTLCDHACINSDGDWIDPATHAGGHPGIAHAKFALFSATKDSTGTPRANVVANGSPNFNREQYIIHNNWVVSYEDQARYDGFEAFFGVLKSQTATPSNPTVSSPVTSSDGLITTYFFPRAASDDPMPTFLDEIDCSKGGRIFGMSSTWNSDRTAVNNALIDKADAGCTIELLMDDKNAPLINDDSAANQLAVPTATGQPMNSNVFGVHGITVYGTSPGGCRYSTEGFEGRWCAFTGGGTHEKYLVIDGKSASGESVRKVISGSPNVAQRALTSYTEVQEIISDPGIVQGFADDFNRQKSQAFKIHPTKYPDATYETVNSGANGSQDFPSVARSANGYTAISWADSANPTLASPDLYGAVHVKLLGSDGTTIYEKAVQTQTGSHSGSDYRETAIGVDNDGNVVVAWQDDHDGNGSYDVVVRRVTNNGTSSPVVGNRFTVHADTDYDQTDPSVARMPDGRFSVAWTDNNQIRMATYSASAAKLAEFQVNGASTGTHSQVDIAVQPAPGGDFTTTAVWRDDSDGNGYGEIYGRAVTSAGADVWAEQRMNSVGAGDQSAPSVAAGADGIVTVWQTYDDNEVPCHVYSTLATTEGPAATGTARCVQAREFNSAGVAAAGQFEVSKGIFETNAYTGGTAIGEQRRPSVAMDDGGSYVVAWEELAPNRPGWDVYARSFTPGASSTAETLSEYRMNPIIPNDQTAPQVASDSSGNFVLVYDDDWDRNGSTQLIKRDGFTLG